MLPPKLVLSPIDFSNPSREALETAARLASQTGAELLLVHVVPALPKLPSATALFNEAEFERELQRDAERRLADLATEFSEKGLKVRTEIGTANDVGMELIRIADHNSADLIVIATHGMTGWHRLAFGSVTEKVVRLSSLPVLVLRAKHAEEHASTGHTAAAAASN